MLLQRERSAWDYAAPAFILSSALITGTGSTSNVAPMVNGTYLHCSVRDLLCSSGPLVRSSLRSLLHDIRSNFELNAVEFSAVLGVSRQTLYDWVAERVEPRIDKQRRLRELFALSEQWRIAVGANIQTVNRKFTDKPELLALLSDVSLSSETKGQRLQILARGRRGVVGTASINDRLTSLGFMRDPEMQQRVLADQGW
jgi:DNA-binding XRE family transcriptional regulator